MNPIAERAATARPTLLDTSRLVWRAWRGQAPTGIDRVCLAYAAHYRVQAQAVIQRDGFRRILSPTVSDELFDLLLEGSTRPRRRLATLIAGASFANEAGGPRPYLNVGHTGLDRPGLRRWIARSGVKPVYMVHDLIPLSHPEYCRPGEAERHAARIATMVDTGTAIIVNSQATLDALADWARASARTLPPALAAWLGTEPLPRSGAPPPIAGRYFVTLGTIEGRKNHLMLFEVWRSLAALLGPATPMLVVIGQRGWEAGQATAMLDRCTALRDHVVEVGGCDDATLAHYLTHAAALLFPSFVEGYGMPLAEALAMGTPVIASDLAVFREIGGDLPRYCDPTDGPAWTMAVLDRQDVVTGYRAPRWDEHFAAVDAWLKTVV